MLQINCDKDLNLKLLTLQEAPLVRQLVDENRVYLRKWLPWVDSDHDLSDTEKFIDANLMAWQRKVGLTMGVWYQEKLVGIISFHRIVLMHRFCTIGYWLAESSQGKGIMTRACKAMIDYAFEKLDLYKVEIRVATENIKSRKIPESLGFKQEGIRRKIEWVNGNFRDHALYGLLKNND